MTLDFFLYSGSSVCMVDGSVFLLPQRMTKHHEPPPPYEHTPKMPSHTSVSSSGQPHVTQVTVNTAAATGGTCPVCHAGKFESAFTVCGWLCCIFCFPCGIICCLCMRKKKCSHCGFSVS
ncbi:membrane protein BRI3-like [Zophobas morio]|uniref:membrane protein BRI3-like n=1 Tax=Zophobas morio TaxID=2755281 RepID=UPI0030833F37